MAKYTLKLTSVLNLLVIIASLAIILVMSMEILHPELHIRSGMILNFHFMVSTIFLTDFFVRLSRAENKWRFVGRNFIFLLVSLPYTSVVAWSGVELVKPVELVIRYVPFIRAIYGFVIVFSYFTRSRSTNLFYTYLIIVLATTYFSSLLFYSVEGGVNPNVDSFDDALWWAMMDMTTVGSNIIPVTGIGRVLAVVLAAGGMMMFPIFTVFITNRFSGRKDKARPQ